MGVIKSDIPILEYDASSDAVVKPSREGKDVHLPSKAVFAFLGDEVDKYAEQNNALIVWKFISITKLFPIYIVSYQGENICLVQAPVGASASAQLMDWLIAHGVESIIAVGSCGTLENIPENTFLVPYRALRDEGTSYHYLPASRYVDIDEDMIAHIEKTLSEHILASKRVMTWTTDGFYRETPDMVKYRKDEGCEVVEMECSALTAVAKMRGVKFGELLFTADSLANIDKHDERNWGKDAISIALCLALDIAINM